MSIRVSPILNIYNPNEANLRYSIPKPWMAKFMDDNISEGTISSYDSYFLKLSYMQSLVNEAY